MGYEVAHGQDSGSVPRALLVEEDGTLNVTLVGGAVGGSTVAQGDPNSGGADAWPVAGKGGEQLALEAGGNLAALVAKLPSALGATTPAASLSVTGSLATTAPTTVADATGTGSEAQLGSLAAGPSGIRVQNTSADGSPNIRVGKTSEVSTTRGVQIRPGAEAVFCVSNANVLYVIAESGSPTYAVSQA